MITRKTYYRMAHEARYRPTAPGDGCGNVTIPLSQLDLEDEAERFVRHFNKEEDEQRYWLGCPNYTQRSEFILLLEAARACCSADPDLALSLAEMAVSNLRVQVQSRKQKPRLG
jgi:hypothetical protein